ARESRLGLAEDMSRDMRRNLSDLTAAIDELEEELEALLSAAPSESADGARACAKRIRALAEDLDARLGKTLVEWEDLKKNEIGLSALESENLNFSGEESDGNV
ncbi:MAG: hypothetical protein FWE09_07525, partial [Treponema sp.]|nr:hypothetical protein [Treponema sp.]